MGRPRLTTTHCNYGHEFTAENTYIHPGKQYRRSCRRCRTIMANASHQKKYRTDPEYRNKVISSKMLIYEKKTPEERRRYINDLRRRNKEEVLTHYGEHGKLKCCWEHCNVCDLDMLSLDHIHDDGAEHRRKLGKKVRGTYQFGGKDIYVWVKTHGFPEGFQTLCMNHQQKKQIVKSRAERLDSTYPESPAIVQGNESTL